VAALTGAFLASFLVGSGFLVASFLAYDFIF